MAWSYKYGHYIWDNGFDDFCADGYYTTHRNITASQLDVWTEDNKDGSIPRRVMDNDQGGYYDSSRALQKGDFLRLKNLTVSYNLPKNAMNKLGVSNWLSMSILIPC